MTMSRRALIQRIGAVGGYAAAYTAMQALGLIAPASAFAQTAPPDLASGGGGKGAKVVILGAGVAGLSSAYELRKAGYDCTVIEARARPGGRAWTVRGGDVIKLTDGPDQTCEYEQGQYFNAGPARLPSHHQIVLGYCRELGVELEVEVNSSRSAFIQNDKANGGKPIQLRRAGNDARGHVSELLAKAINKGALDQELTGDDKLKMMAFLKTYGDLSSEMLYKGSQRAGLKTQPGAGDEKGTAFDPLPLRLLLEEDMWNGVLFEETIDMQATMFQPKGGMDRISYAFAKALGPLVKFRSEVRSIKKTATGVRVAYRDIASGKDVVVDADYCICTIPLIVLKDIEVDLSPAYKAVVDTTAYRDSLKIAWQAPRFWEGPQYQIYGGLSHVKGANALIWYPSYALHSKTGVILGAYTGGAGGAELVAMGRQAAFEYTRKSIDQLHPGGGMLLEKPLMVRWGTVPYNFGISGSLAQNQAGYDLLGQPDGPIYFAGEHLSHVGAWQEGAIRSAHRTIVMLDAKHRKGQPVATYRMQ